MPLYRGFPDPVTRYGWNASDRGLLASNGPVEMFTQNAVPGTAGRLEGARVRLPVAAPVTNIVLSCQTVGNTLTSGQCFAALWTPAGVLVAQTADQAASWVSTGVKTMALAGGPFSLPAGIYYAAWWYNGTTSPAWLRGPSTGAPTLNLGVSAPNLFWFTADTGLTTTAPSTLGAQTTSASAWWVGLS